MRPKFRMLRMGRLSVVSVFLIWLFASVQSLTNDQDVFALNELYVAVNSPPLPGWVASGGDPCLENWAGVACAGPNVTILTLSGLSLTGGLGSALDNLTTLIVLNVSNNFLTGGLPLQLPPHVQQLILSGNQFTGNLPLSLSELSNLAILNVSSNLLSGSVPDIFDQLGNLNTLDLANNNFGSSLPQSFGDLASLTTLYLENNQFTGTIDILAHLPLTTLDISSNSFTGWIPSDLRYIPFFNFAGNVFSTGPAPPPPPFFSPPPSHEITQDAKEDHSDSKKTHGFGRYLTVARLVGIVVAALLAVVVAVFVVLFFVSKNQGRREDKFDPGNSWQGPLIPAWKDQNNEPESRNLKSSTEVSMLKRPPVDNYRRVPPESPEANDSLAVTMLKPPPVESYRMRPPAESYKLEKSKGSKMALQTKGVRVSINATEFTIAELQIATQSFSLENLIGTGSLGKVYKAELPSGKIVAVKKLDYSIIRMQEEDFMEVLCKISGLHHENITELVGYSVEHGEHLLVYEYISNGSLHDYLHVEVESQRLSWNRRITIALGVARALEYLHEERVPAVVHHNMTSFNILLDKNFNPYLSDCGLATLTSPEELHKASAAHLDFRGYSAPEHTTSGIYTIKSDVYSFGVVMLELLTGRKPLDSARPRSEQNLVRWAVNQLHDIEALARMVDPALKGSYPVKSISRFADVIVLCIQPQPEFRPPMSEVAQSLMCLLQ